VQAGGFFVRRIERRGAPKVPAVCLICTTLVRLLFFKYGNKEKSGGFA